jgi:DNA repair protein RadA/Sms
MALASAFRNRPCLDTAVWGEVGLGGEIRPVPATDRRLAEAAKLGIKKAVAPLPKKKTAAKLPPGIEVKNVRTVAEVLGLL